MRKIGFALVLLLLCSGLAGAQIPTSANVFFGYSYYNTTNLSTGDRTSINGWEASVEGKIVPFIGFVADFDSHYGTLGVVCLSGAGPCSYTSGHEENFLFGPRVGAPVGKFRPFAEALFGAAHVNVNPNSFISDNSFATAVGGGLDYKIIRPLAWRFQGDYVHTHFVGAAQNNVRISTGIVLRF